MQGIKAVLFDLDGTLADSLPLIRYSFQRVFQDMDIPWEDGRIMETVGLPLLEVAREYAGERAEIFFQLYLKHQLEKHDDYIKLFPGTVEMLSRIRSRGLKTGIVTSKRRAMAEKAVKITNLSSLIDVMVALEDCCAHKPDPLPVVTAMQKLKSAPGETVFVGDSCYDMDSGRGAGAFTVGVTWGAANRARLAGSSPGFIADGWEDVIQLLEV